MLVIPKTRNTPLVHIDNQLVYIEGRSIPEDANAFYQPLFDDFELKRELRTNALKVDLRLDYFNTSSSGIIMKYLKLLEQAKADGMDVKVTWRYASYDDDMREAGEDFYDVVPLLNLEILENES